MSKKDFTELPGNIKGPPNPTLSFSAGGGIRPPAPPGDSKRYNIGSKSITVSRAKNTVKITFETEVDVRALYKELTAKYDQAIRTRK